MNSIIKQERAHTIGAMSCLAYDVVAADDGRIRNQTITTCWREYTEGGQAYRIRAVLRFDDSCNNGHEAFAITGTINRKHRGQWVDDAEGCIHEDIARRFPALQPLIKWHLCSTDGPVHYIQNTTYHAGDLDYNGLRKGESRQIMNGRTGLPCWKLETIGIEGNVLPRGAVPEYIDAATQPECTLQLMYMPLCRIGEGKARELAYARSSAVWPEATDAELMLPKEELTAILAARLPALLVDFKKAMTEYAGFLWPVARAQP